ncbi:hypothetical protein P3X46_004437 [Hevea brasiliensis]|uniref:Endonuclease/exonuclease/phosphatase domain-containing protein n=1 Tax=Hevea brasiliensis TaxID=3981 RepID=A0ABQ9MWR8_HEVBR|nr:hypothetical protein P3X46_004437 [Hevea brasiliensis]
MICLSWNCRSLVNPRAVRAQKELILSKKTNIIFLCETLVHSNKIEEIKVHFGYYYNYNLFDIPLHAYSFTWERGRGIDRWIRERLDRALVSPLWLSLFENCKLSTLQALVSYHSPILLETYCGRWIEKSWRFQIENFWLSHSDIYDVVKDFWDETVGEQISKRILLCGHKLQEWGKALRGGFRKEVDQIKRELCVIQCKEDGISVFIKDGLKEDFNRVLSEEEIFWKQRSKIC